MSGDPRFHAARLVLALRQVGVMDQRVTEALEKTPREPFVPRVFADSAWEDVELPIDCGQTLTRPVMVGQMIAALDLKREHVVLEVGTGSGYPAAAMSRLSRRIYTIDRYRTLVEKARISLDQLGIERVETRVADGLLGWPEIGVFDRIIMMGAVDELPRAILEQAGPAAVIVAPVNRDGKQRVIRFARQADGTFEESVVSPSRFTALEPGVARQL
jgi:protein-L-isoaspartate(D-aspartate) O-methyltransferase